MELPHCRFRRSPLLLGLALAAVLALGGGIVGHAEGQSFDDLIEVGGGRIQLTTIGAELSPARARLRGWAERSARIVAGYYGRFPVGEVAVYVSSQAGSGVGHGITFRERVGIINVSVGTDVTPEELRTDWVLVHEVIHLALPNLERRHVWLAEGIATYVESVARVQAGELDAAAVWSAFQREMPRGLPRAGDQGLDRTHTWGRTYWGGALFCLLADVDILERTSGGKGLQDAFTAVAEASRMDFTRWAIDEVVRVGDEATGTTVLTNLYAAMRDMPVSPDLDALWSSLGVGVRGAGSVTKLDEEAPRAHLRRLITRPRNILQDR